MLTLFDFNGLDGAEKAEAVWKGTFLSNRAEGNLTVQLYNLGAFWVEVYYDSQSNKIMRFNAFSGNRIR
jgi:hypothetical protein